MNFKALDKRVKRQKFHVMVMRGNGSVQRFQYYSLERAVDVLAASVKRGARFVAIGR